MTKLYRTNPTGPLHYIEGRLVEPGSVVALPDRITPGEFLKEVPAKETRAAQQELSDEGGESAL